VKRLLLFLVWGLALSCASAQTVSLSVPAVDDSGASLSSGQAFITWQPFFDNSGNRVAGGSKTAPIVQGRLAVSLVASDNAGYVYKVLLQSGGNATTYLWRVPATGATTMAQLTQQLPSSANQIRLNLRTHTCDAENDGVLRKMPGGSAESLQVCLSSSSSFFASLSADLSKAATQLVRIRVLGDSITRCWGAAGNTQAACAGIGPVTFGNLWVERLRSWLNARYLSHGSGLIPVVASIPGNKIDNNFYTVTGTYTASLGFDLGVPYQTQNGSSMIGGGGIHLNANANISMKATSGKTLNVYYVTYADTTTAGFNVTIDGQAKGTYGTESGPAGGYYKASVDAGSLANHQASLSCNGSDCYIYAFEWVTNPNGVAVDNLSVAACAAECFGANPNSAMAVIDLTNNGARVYDIVALGMNDYLRDADLGVYGSNMSGIISHAQATGVQSVFVFNMPWTTAGSANGIDMNSIFSTAQSLASANKYDYADVVHDGPFANTAAIAASGYYNPSDQIHLSDAGHNALWNLLQARLMTINYNWYPVTLGAALVP
jgi:hypothetical protein